jgi:hypothetical protein
MSWSKAAEFVGAGQNYHSQQSDSGFAHNSIVIPAKPAAASG